MSQLLEAARIALGMILSGDGVVYSIALRTMVIAVSATIISSAVFIPLGSIVHFSSFTGRRLLVSMIQTLYSVPTVLVGMLVFLLISRAGPLGSMNLLFTPAAIVAGDVLLIAPIIMGLTISALETGGRELRDTAISLGAGRGRMVLKVLSESRQAILTAVLMAFGRSVSEVGVAIMVGGNIAGYTRTLTTAIVLEVGRGETAYSIALGIILLILAMVVSISVNTLQHRRSR